MFIIVIMHVIITAVLLSRSNSY